MRKNILSTFALLALSALFSVACSNATQKHSVSETITTTRAISPFTELEIEGVFNIILKQDNKESVQIESVESFQELVVVEQKGSLLKIGLRKNSDIKSDNKCNVYVTLKDITNLKITSVGNVKCENTLKLNRLMLDFSGVGKIDLDLECNQFDASLSSVGALSLTGSSQSANISHAGVGSLNAFGFNVGYLSVQHSGVGSIEVYAEKEISAVANGIGSIRYKGNAVPVKLEMNGIGTIKKVE